MRCKKAQELAEEHPEWAFLYQYANEANPRAHYETTGPEILRDVPDITHFVAGLGTSGTLLGVGTYLKEQNPDIEIHAIEPPVGLTVEGLRNLEEGYIPPVYEKWGGDSLLNGKRIVGPASPSSGPGGSAASWACSAGSPAGAAVAGAAKLAERIDRAVIVVVLADGGWKYLSTGAWTDPLDDVVERAERIIYF